MKLSDAFGQYGPLLAGGALFLVVGLATTGQILLGLVTGGPRARLKPGTPYLYDRVFYVLFAIAITGWWMAMLSFAGELSGPVDMDSVSGFMTGWGIGAIGMGLLIWLRGNMLLEGARYLSRHGFLPFRLFHLMQVRQFEYAPVVRKIIPVVFIAAGIVALAVNITKLPLALAQASTGAHLVWSFLSKLQLA